jgi:polar amino acid transport system substrate-binding protein
LGDGFVVQRGNRKALTSYETVAARSDARLGIILGAFSFNMGNDRLLHDVNRKLRKYLGSADHRSRMAKYGITETEIDGVIGLS